MNDSTEGQYEYEDDSGTLEYTQECFILESISQGNPQVRQRKPLHLSGNSLPKGCETELQLVEKKLTSDPNRLLKRSNIIRNVAGEEKDKNYVLEEIEGFLSNCSKQGGKRNYSDVEVTLVATVDIPFAATVWYFGDSQHETGNWYIREETFITFKDIFNIYKRCFKGKILTIISDCPYAGRWTLDCVEELDRLQIPSCGHHTREKQLLLKVYASCAPDQIATEAWFVSNAVVNDSTTHRLYFGGKSTENQLPTVCDFTRLRCSQDPYKKCDADESWSWNDAFVHGGTLKRRLYLVRGKDRGRPAWHYVLVRTESIGEFLKRIDSGTVDVANYGKVITSGWGTDPPENIKQRFSSRF